MDDDTELRSLTREKAYELCNAALEDGCMGVQIHPRRDGEHFDVDASYSQGPYQLDKFQRIQQIAEAYGLTAYFSLNGQGMRVWFR